MIKRVLIANRGEIAVRIIRACKEMGIETVAVYSEADKYSLHTQMADFALCIGKSPVRESYLNMENIISAGDIYECDAVHPGYGFLSENSSFAELVEQYGMKYIGPSPESIDLMGNKSKARETVKGAGVPIIPGSDGNISDVDKGLVIAEEIGYPVIIKAAAGGGGKGMRIAKDKDEFIKNFSLAKMEANSAFSDDSVYVEKFIENPRHIEIQILCDAYGNGVYLGERDCSLQRRNQKVLEEAPAYILSDEKRKTMGECALKAAKAAGYVNAGTVEFLLDKDGKFYFIEMNTRIQVEHPITEMITGIDLIKEQIRIASGEKLNLSQEDIKITGHAIECRINAEDPEKNFSPSPGVIENLHMPGGMGIRIESSIYPGCTISPFYDSMVAKVIAYGRDRDEAIQRMKRALSEFVVEGIKTNIEFQLKILKNEDYLRGEVTTSFLRDIK